MTDGFHPPVEEYLETIHSLTEEGTPVIQARIAQRMGRTAPSVSEMLERLTDDGYVERSGRVIALTERGRTLADSVIRKHRLAERLLVDVIGLPWHKAHLEAGRWEHVISDEVETHLVTLLGNPSTCPHGNPIPGPDGGDDRGAAGEPGRRRAGRAGAPGEDHRGGRVGHGLARVPGRARVHPRPIGPGAVPGPRRNGDPGDRRRDRGSRARPSPSRCSSPPSDPLGARPDEK